MSLEFRSNPYVDTLIYSGVDLNYERCTPLFLKGEAKERANEKVRKSYVRYKQSLRISYNDFYEQVKSNIHHLRDPVVPSHARLAVANKLKSLAEEQLKVHGSREKKLGFFTKKSKAQKGLDLAGKIETIDEDIYKSTLKYCINHGFGLKINEKSPGKTLDEVKERYNTLTEEQFNELLTDVLFHEKSDPWPFFGTIKYQFYGYLDQEKREILHQELLSHKDWFEQSLDIVMGTDPKKYANEFVSQLMIQRFIQDLDKVIDIYKKSSANGFTKKLFQTLLECSIRHYLKQDTPEAYIQIYLLNYGTNKRVKHIELWKVLEHPIILNHEEIEQLNTNLTL